MLVWYETSGFCYLGLLLVDLFLPCVVEINVVLDLPLHALKLVINGVDIGVGQFKSPELGLRGT